jgi:hypothetical protein
MLHARNLAPLVTRPSRTASALPPPLPPLPPLAPRLSTGTTLFLGTALMVTVGALAWVSTLEEEEDN